MRVLAVKYSPGDVVALIVMVIACVAILKFGCADPAPTAYQCAQACGSRAMRIFDPTTGKCECVP